MNFDNDSEQLPLTDLLPVPAFCWSSCFPQGRHLQSLKQVEIKGMV